VSTQENPRSRAVAADELQVVCRYIRAKVILGGALATYCLSHDARLGYFDAKLLGVSAGNTEIVIPVRADDPRRQIMFTRASNYSLHCMGACACSLLAGISDGTRRVLRRVQRVMGHELEIHPLLRKFH